MGGYMFKAGAEKIKLSVGAALRSTNCMVSGTLYNAENGMKNES